MQACIDLMQQKAPQCSQAMSIDALAHSFFMHMAAVLLARCRASHGDFSLSTWAGTIAPCKCRKSRPRSRRGTGDGNAVRTKQPYYMPSLIIFRVILQVHVNSLIVD